MKILHTADWHLGKKLERFERLGEQQQVLEEICVIAEEEQVDAVLIAGDLFDAFVPTNEASELYYKTLRRLTQGGKRPVVAIAGNHDSPDRIEAPDPLARASGILLAGYPQSHLRPLELETGLEVLQSAPGFIELKIPNVGYPLRILLTPYANEGRMRKDLGADDPEAMLRDILHGQWKSLAEKYCDESGVNVAMAHLFMVKKGEKEEEQSEEEERPIMVGNAQVIYAESVPEGVQYMALGHLHRHHGVGGGPCACVYAGSPLAYSFAEAGQAKGVVIVEVEPGQAAAYRFVRLSAGLPLHRKVFNQMDAAVEWLSQHPESFVELTLETETYIAAEDRKRLFDAHDRITKLIPRITNEQLLPHEVAGSFSLSEGMESLFQKYFKHKNGQEPSEEIMALFREVLGTEVES
jgi:exonuclease SbcD